MSAQNFASASSGWHRGPDAAAALGKTLTPFGGNAEDITKGIVDAARCGIQIRVHTDGRDAIFHQKRGYIVGVQAFDGVEDDRVMADDELAVVFHSPHDGGGNVHVVSTLSTGVPASTSSPTLSQSSASAAARPACSRPKICCTLTDMMISSCFKHYCATVVAALQGRTLFARARLPCCQRIHFRDKFPYRVTLCAVRQAQTVLFSFAFCTA